MPAPAQCALPRRNVLRTGAVAGRAGDRGAEVLHRGNGQEPEDLDPHIINGVSEYNVIAALLEGLVSEDPKTLEPVPGVAERWDISDDGTLYTFHFRKTALQPV